MGSARLVLDVFLSCLYNSNVTVVLNRYAGGCTRLRPSLWSSKSTLSGRSVRNSTSVGRVGQTRTSPRAATALPKRRGLLRGGECGLFRQEFT